MIDVCWVFAIATLVLIGISVRLYLIYRALKYEIGFFSEHYQRCFLECQKLRDMLGMEQIKNALDEYKSRKRKAGETVDYI